MRIAWIGGLSRNRPRICAIAQRAGHVLEVHSGVVHGRGVEEIRAIVSRVDLVVLVTDVNSHGGVSVAKRCCRRCGRDLRVVKRCGAARFRALLADFDEPPRAA